MGERGRAEKPCFSGFPVPLGCGMQVQPKKSIEYRHVTNQPERPVKLPCGPDRRGALAAIFGRWSLYGIGPRAALLQHHTPCGAPLAVQMGICNAREPDSARKRVSCGLMDNPGSTLVDPLLQPDLDQ